MNLIDPDGLDPFGGLFTSLSFGKFQLNPFATIKSSIESLPSGTDLISYHYNRNEFNQVVSYDKAKTSWNGKVPAMLHQLPGWNFNLENFGNQKFVSPDGKSEVVFTHEGKLVKDCLNMGTYNYASPTNDKIGHLLYDMLPYFLLGNCPDCRETCE